MTRDQSDNNNLPPWLRDEPLPPRPNHSDPTPNPSASKGEQSFSWNEPASSSAAASFTQDDTPDWLKEISTNSGTPQSASSNVPDWLHEASPASASPQPIDNNTDAVPDWLRAAPADTPAQSSPAASDDIPDWLREIASEPGSPSSADASNAQPASGASSAGNAGTVPDWLREEITNQPSESTNVPDWLREQVTETPQRDASHIPSWVSEDVPDTRPEESAHTSDTPDWLYPAPEAPAHPEARVPDWLSEQSATPAASPADVPQPSRDSFDSAPSTPSDTSDVTSWFDNISTDSVKQAMSQEDVGSDAPEPFQFEGLGEPPSRPASSGPPAWLGDASDESSPTWLDQATNTPDVSRQPQRSAAEPDVPAWLQDIAADSEVSGPTAQPSPSQSTSFTQDWFGGGSQTPAQPEVPASSDVPSWLQDAGQPPAVEPVAPDRSDWLRDTAGPSEPPLPVAPTVDAGVPSWLRDVPTEAPATPQDSVPSWLREGVDETRQEANDVPEWLRAAEPSNTPIAPAPPASDVPEWLRDASPTPPVDSTPNDIPLWLQDAERSTPAPAPQSDLPLWLQDNQDSSSATLQGVPLADERMETPPAAPPPGEPEAPPWLRDEVETPPAAPSPGEPDIPPWLRDEAGSPLSTAGAPGDANLPSWLHGATLDTSPPEAPRMGARPSNQASTGSSFGDWFDGAGTSQGEAVQENENTFLGGTDLPAWLRPPEVKPAAPSAQEESRSLDWLTRLGTPEEEETVAIATGPRLTPPVMPRRSEAQLAAIGVLQRLAAEPYPQSAPLPAVTERSLWQRLGAERLLYTLLLIGLLVALLVPSLASSLQGPPTVPGAQPLAEQLSTFGPQDIVLISYDWDARRIGELRPLEQAVIDQLIQQRVKLVLMSTDPQGTMLLYDLRDKLISQGYNGGGVDYVLLGYRPGGELALRGLAQNLPATLAFDFQSQDLSQSGIVTGLTTGTNQTLDSVDDFSMVLVLGDDSVDVQGWMEQVHPTSQDVPFAFLLPAEATPIIQPYLQLRDVYHLSGERGALAYQAVRTGGSVSEQLAIAVGRQRLSLLVFVGLLLVGGIISGIAAAFRRRKA